MRAKLLPFALFTACMLFASRSDYLSIKQKFLTIQNGRAARGTRVPIPSTELNAYVQTELPKVVPQGIREPVVELLGNNSARATAYVNFLKMQNARGQAPGWLMRNLLNGEHQLVVTANMNSAKGSAVVYLTRVEIGGVPVEGAALNFLIENYLLPNYPEARIGKPFQLDYNMDRVEVKPGVAYVVIR